MRSEAGVLFFVFFDHVLRVLCVCVCDNTLSQYILDSVLEYWCVRWWLRNERINVVLYECVTMCMCALRQDSRGQPEAIANH